MAEIPIKLRLAEARKRAGFSQKELGIKAGIDEFSASARMNQYEKGKYNPDYLTLKNIGKVLGVPVSYFYTDDDDLAEVILTYASLKPRGKSSFRKYLRALLED